MPVCENDLVHTHTDTHTPSRQGQAPRGQLVPGACACASNPSPEARAPSCWVTEKHVWGGHRQSPLVAGGCGSHRAGILEDADPRASLTEVPIRQSLGICILTAQAPHGKKPGRIGCQGLSQVGWGRAATHPAREGREDRFAPCHLLGAAGIGQPLGPCS